MIYILIMVVLLGFYNGYLLLDDKTKEDAIENKKIEKKWHFVGAVLFTYVAIIAGLSLGWKYAPFTFLCFLIIFGGIVHIVGLKKPFFYIGTTAFTDRLQRKIFPKKPELWSGIIKVVLLICSILLILIK